MTKKTTYKVYDSEPTTMGYKKINPKKHKIKSSALRDFRKRVKELRKDLKHVEEDVGVFLVETQFNQPIKTAIVEGDKIVIHG